MKRGEMSGIEVNSGMFKSQEPIIIITVNYLGDYYLGF